MKKIKIYLRCLEILSELVPQFSRRVDCEYSGHRDTYSSVRIRILNNTTFINNLENFKKRNWDFPCLNRQVFWDSGGFQQLTARNNQCFNSYLKVTGCLSVYMLLKISLTAKPIWFFFTEKLLIGPGKVFFYFVASQHS